MGSSSDKKKEKASVPAAGTEVKVKHRKDSANEEKDKVKDHPNKLRKVKKEPLKNKKPRPKRKMATNGTATEIGGFTIIGDISQFKKTTVFCNLQS